MDGEGFFHINDEWLPLWKWQTWYICKRERCHSSSVLLRKERSLKAGFCPNSRKSASKWSRSMYRLCDMALPIISGMVLCRAGSWSQWPFWVPSNSAYSVSLWIIVIIMHTSPLKPMEVDSDFKAHRSRNTVNVWVWWSLHGKNLMKLPTRNYL